MAKISSGKFTQHFTPVLDASLLFLSSRTAKTVRDLTSDNERQTSFRDPRPSVGSLACARDDNPSWNRNALLNWGGEMSLPRPKLFTQKRYLLLPNRVVKRAR